MEKDFSVFVKRVTAKQLQARNLAELNRYRALEQKLNGISIEQIVNGFLNTVKNETHEDYVRGKILTNKKAEDWNAYQELGAVEELKSMKENGAFTGVELAQIYAMQRKLRQYQELGTVEEFKALKEKINQKK